MNKSFLIGNIGQDAEVKATSQGRKYLAFSIAVSDGKDAQGNAQTLWFNVSGWTENFVSGKLLPYLTKGSKVCLVGKQVPTLWTKEDGTVSISHNFFVNEIELCGSANAGQRQDPPQPPLPNLQPQATPLPAGTIPDAQLNTMTNDELVKDDDLSF